MIYNAKVSRERGWWLAEIVDVPGAHTEARDIPSLR
jgi:hypothetical protein